MSNAIALKRPTRRLVTIQSAREIVGGGVAKGLVPGTAQRTQFDAASTRFATTTTTRAHQQHRHGGGRSHTMDNPCSQSTIAALNYSPVPPDDFNQAYAALWSWATPSATLDRISARAARWTRPRRGISNRLAGKHIL